MKHTKEKILHTALELFSEKGFDGTSMQDIAGRVGLTKAALYRHFAGKEALFDALIKSLRAHYEAGLGAAAENPPVPGSPAELVATSMAQVRFTVADETIIRVRRLLTLSQFRNAHIAAAADEYFHAGLERMYTAVFAGMMERGLLRETDPSLLALEYVAPVGELIRLCDREPQKTEETLAEIERFLNGFIRVWGKKADENHDHSWAKP